MVKEQDEQRREMSTWLDTVRGMRSKDSHIIDFKNELRQREDRNGGDGSDFEFDTNDVIEEEEKGIPINDRSFDSESDLMNIDEEEELF